MKTALGLILLSVIGQVWANPELELSANRSVVYNGQLLTLMCTAQGTQVLTWEIDEYIGRGNHLTVSSSQEPGLKIWSEGNADVYAFLISTTTNNRGEVTIKSQLTVIVSLSQTYFNFTIICRDNIGMTASAIYHISSKNAVFINLTSDVDRRVCPGDAVYFECIALETDLIMMVINFTGNYTEHFCSKYGDPPKTVTVSGISLVFKKSYSTDADGIPMLTCGIRMNMPFDNGDDLSTFFGCKNHALGMWANTTIQLAKDCDNATTSDADLFTDNTTMNHAATLSSSEVVHMNIISLGLGLAMIVLLS